MNRARSKDRSATGCASWVGGRTITMPTIGVGVGEGATAGTVGTTWVGGGGGTRPVPGRAVAVAGGGSVGWLVAAGPTAVAVATGCGGKVGVNWSGSSTGVQVGVGVLISPAGCVGMALLPASGTSVTGWVGLGVACGDSGVGVAVGGGKSVSWYGGSIPALPAAAGRWLGSNGRLMASAITASRSNMTRSRAMRGGLELTLSTSRDKPSGATSSDSGAGCGVGVGLGLLLFRGSWLTTLPVVTKPFPRGRREWPDYTPSCGTTLMLA